MARSRSEDQTRPGPRARATVGVGPSGDRRPRRRRLPAALVAVAALTGVATAGCTDAPPEATTPTRPLRADVTVTLGDREVVLDSEAKAFPDSRYVTYAWNGHTYGVLSGGGIHVRYDDALAVPLTGGTELHGLEPGPQDVDARAVRLDGVYTDPAGTLHGIYDAERPLPEDRDPSVPRHSLAYAESRDGGLTWTKPSYPDNLVLTGSSGGEAADASLLVVDDWLYAFFSQNRQPAMARAPIADAGRPGSWRKWYCLTDDERDKAGIPVPKPGEKPPCDFSQPGIGGKATALTGLKDAPMVTRNRDLQAYLAVDDTVREGRVGFKTSEDLETWLGVANQPNLPEPQPGWGDVAPTQVADDGSTATTGRSFWLYYIEWNVPQSQKRLLVRQRVTLSAVGA